MHVDFRIGRRCFGSRPAFPTISSLSLMQILLFLKIYCKDLARCTGTESQMPGVCCRIQ
jgi:hypothetical protein